MAQNTTEAMQNEIIMGDVPHSVLQAARTHFNLSPDEIWGVYLTPDDPRNPKPGEHYLGKSSKTPEQMITLISKEASSLDKSSELQNQWANRIEELKLMPQPKLAELIENGGQIIERHEKKHKEQWEHTNYQTIILQASKVMRDLDTKAEENSEAQKRAIRISYQDLVLTAEVQALAAQTAKQLPYAKEFSLYWFSKTFELYNISVEEKIVPGHISFDTNKKHPLDVEYVSKPVPVLQTLFIDLSNGSEFNSRVSNVYGLLSRALFVCEDPAAVLDKIRTNQINYNEFTSLVLSGLDKIKDQSVEELTRRAENLSTSMDGVLQQNSQKLKKLIQ